MAETADHIRDLLEKIRDDAQRALALMANGTESRSLSWKCTGCGHMKLLTQHGISCYQFATNFGTHESTRSGSIDLGKSYLHR